MTEHNLASKASLTHNNHKYSAMRMIVDLKITFLYLMSRDSIHHSLKSSIEMKKYLLVNEVKTESDSR